MWRDLLLFCSICTAAVGETVIGNRGEQLEIKCRYEAGSESNVKYLCKGSCRLGLRNKIVQSGSRPKDKRFSLRDNRKARVFTITITDLRTEDAGEYWCGVEGWFYDGYQEISLIVKNNEKSTRRRVPSTTSSDNVPSSISTAPEQHPFSTPGRELSTDSVKYIGFGFSFFFFLLATTVFCKKKRSKKKQRASPLVLPQNGHHQSGEDGTYMELNPNRMSQIYYSLTTPANHKK